MPNSPASEERLGFISIDALVVVPPSCMNADEDGRPKTAQFGDTSRLRWSSQAQKRAWRTSSVFQGLDRSLRTREEPGHIYRALVAGGVAAKLAEDVAKNIGAQFGSVDAKKNKPEEMRHSEIVVYEPEELAAINALVDTTVRTGKAPGEDELKKLPRKGIAVDVALFGRMRAAQKEFSVDASCAVAHAIAATRSRVEVDYWSAVDDLAVQSAESGSAHINERSLAAGVMYQHVDVDVDSLVRNLNNDNALAGKAVEALVRAVASVHPGAGKSQFGTNLLADYVRVTLSRQPVSLIAAFEQPAENLATAIERLIDRAETLKTAYGMKSDATDMSVPDQRGSLNEVVHFASSVLG
jgi:CRISPR system Cascade subunit CasC